MAHRSSNVPFCAICGLPLRNGAAVPTTSGGQVHLHCAERQSRAAARERAVRAAGSAAILAGVLMLVVGLAVGSWGLVAVLALCVLAHVRVNHRWWLYLIQSIRLWLGIRG